MVAALAGVIEAMRAEKSAPEKLQDIERVFTERGGMEQLQADCEAVQAWSNNNYFPLLTPP